MKKIFLKENEIYDAIINYCSQGNNNELSAEKELRILDDEIFLDFYLIEKIQKDKIVMTHKYCITESDLRDVFNHYLEPQGLELNGFKYSGGIRRVGYYIDEDTPIFEGVELSVREKSKKKVLSFF